MKMETRNAALKIKERCRANERAMKQRLQSSLFRKKFWINTFHILIKSDFKHSNTDLDREFCVSLKLDYR